VTVCGRLRIGDTHRTNPSHLLHHKRPSKFTRTNNVEAKGDDGMRRNTYVILIATALVAAVSLFLLDREPPENAVQPPATTSTTTSAEVRDTGASTDEPAEEYSYGRGYVVEDPDPTEIQRFRRGRHCAGCYGQRPAPAPL